MKRGPVTVL